MKSATYERTCLALAALSYAALISISAIAADSAARDGESNLSNGERYVFTYPNKSGALTVRSELDEIAAASTNYAYSVARVPHTFTVAGGPTHVFSGNSGFPAGLYYRVNAGDGKLAYAAKAPVPSGSIVVTGDEDDPMIAHFGSSFRVDASSLTLTGLSGYVEDGQYSIADFSYEVFKGSGITAQLHSNIIAGQAELSNVTGNYYFTFDSTDGLTHYISISEGWTPVPTGYSTTYSHEWYDPGEGEWGFENKTIVVGYSTAEATDYEFAMFGGTDIATMDNVDTARSQLKERLGRYGELGTGWGYKVYDFTNDERYWELKVPRMNVAVNDQPHNNSAMYAVSETVQVSELPEDAIDTTYNVLSYSPRCWFLPPNYKSFIKKVVSTKDKYSTDASKTVDYRVGFVPRDPEAMSYEAPSDFGVTLVATNISIAASGQPYLWGGVAFENLASAGLDFIVKNFSLNWATNSVMYDNLSGSTPYWRYYVRSYDGTDYTNLVPIHVSYELSHFRPSVSFNNYIATVTVSFDVSTISECVYLSSEGWKLWTGHYRTRTNGGSFTATLRTVSALDTITEHANHVITDYNQHMFWDNGYKCTWLLSVTNGVFNAEKISNLDYREKEYVE